MKILDVTLLWMTLVLGACTAPKMTAAHTGESIFLYTSQDRTSEKLAYIKWTFNNRKIVTYTAEGGESRAEAYADRIELDHFTGTLKLQNLQVGDSGNYVVHIKSAEEFAKMKSEIARKVLTMDIRDYVHSIRIANSATNVTEININLYGKLDEENPLTALY